MSQPWRPAPTAPRLSASDHLLKAVSRFARWVHPSLTEALLGAAPTNDRGTALDPTTHLLVGIEGRAIEAKSTPDKTRRNMRRGVALIDHRHTPLHSIIETLVCDELPVRIYRPSNAADLPWMMILHGGGWVTGDLDSHDAFCRRLAVEGTMVVAAVDYRLAPEHPFPAAVDDASRAWAALAACIDRFGADPTRGAVGGDSAGGNLAAVLCQQLRDGACPGPLPVAQLLMYPVTDFRRRTPSHRLFAEGYLLTADSIDRYKAMYAAPDDSDPRVSPLLHPHLTGLPPAVVVTAGFDPLRDEGEQYVHALRKAAVPTAWLEGPSLVHGFVQMMDVVAAADAVVGESIRVTGELLRTGRLPPGVAEALPPAGS